MKMTNRVKGILVGAIGAPIIVGLIVLALTVLSWAFIMPKANAADWPFPEPPHIFFGLDYETGDTFCRFEGSGKSYEHIVSNIGVGQRLWESESKRHSWEAKYQHHSCGFSVDKNSYDGIGVLYVWSPWRG